MVAWAYCGDNYGYLIIVINKGLPCEEVVALGRIPCCNIQDGMGIQHIPLLGVFESLQ